MFVIASYHQTLTNVYLFSDGSILSRKREMTNEHIMAIRRMPNPIARNGSVCIYDLESEVARVQRWERPSLFGRKYGLTKKGLIATMNTVKFDTLEVGDHF